MKFKASSLASFICFVIILGFSPTVLAKTNMAVYTNSDKGFSVQYPGNWEKRENINKYTSFMALSPLENKDDSFRENVNIVTEPAPGYSMETYAKASLGPMNKGLKSFRLISSGAKTINNIPGRWIIYTHNYNGVPLEVKSYFFHNGKTGFVYTATANPTTFKHYEPVFDQIISTFKMN